MNITDILYVLGTLLVVLGAIATTISSWIFSKKRHNTWISKAWEKLYLGLVRGGVAVAFASACPLMLRMFLSTTFTPCFLAVCGAGIYLILLWSAYQAFREAVENFAHTAWFKTFGRRKV